MTFGGDNSGAEIRFIERPYRKVNIGLDKTVVYTVTKVEYEDALLWVEGRAYFKSDVEKALSYMTPVPNMKKQDCSYFISEVSKSKD